MKNLKVGGQVLLPGTVYTTRDATYKRIFAPMEEDEPLLFSMGGAVIYYTGPTPTPKGMAIGSRGLITSGRTDPFVSYLLDMGFTVMVGKGNRSQKVVNAIRRNGAFYLCVIGGAGVLAAQCVQLLQVVAFDDLGRGSVKRLELCDLPLVAAIDSKGNSLFLEI